MKQVYDSLDVYRFGFYTRLLVSLELRCQKKKKKKSFKPIMTYLTDYTWDIFFRLFLYWIAT